MPSKWNYELLLHVKNLLSSGVSNCEKSIGLSEVSWISIAKFSQKKQILWVKLSGFKRKQSELYHFSNLFGTN